RRLRPRRRARAVPSQRYRIPSASFRYLPGRAYADERADGSGDGARDEDDSLVFVAGDHLQVADRDPLRAHVAGHASALINTARRGARTNRARGAMAVALAVRLGAAAEVVAPHATLETAAFRGAGHVYQLAIAEQLDPHLVAERVRVAVCPEFGQVTQLEVAGRFQVAALRLVQALV